MNDFNFILAIQKLSYSFIPVLLGIILHEVAHGYAAMKQGDYTAYMSGRITMNPIPHIDPMGLVVFLFTAMFSPFVFGWAKPVPVNYRYFKDIRKGIFYVSAAGPLANLFLACFFALLFYLLALIPTNILGMYSGSFEFLFQMCTVGVWANIGLMWINLIPIPPLDGSKLLMTFMPAQMAYKYADFERYGMIVLMILIFTGIFGYIITPFIKGTVFAILTLFNFIFGV